MRDDKISESNQGNEAVIPGRRCDYGEANCSLINYVEPCLKIDICFLGDGNNVVNQRASDRFSSALAKGERPRTGWHDVKCEPQSLAQVDRPYLVSHTYKLNDA